MVRLRWAIILCVTGSALLVGCARTQDHAERSNNVTGRSVGTQEQNMASSAQPIHDHVPTSSEILHMSPDELAKYALDHGPLPFAGERIARIDPQQATSVFGTRDRTQDRTTFNRSQYHIIDSWSGSVSGKTFLLDIYKRNDGGCYVMGLADATHVTFSKTFHENIWIINFTGSYMVFATPNAAQGTPKYALNLATGQLVADSEMAQEMSGILMGGYPGEIGGLPQDFEGD
jgi:hypothetical protein